MSKLLVLSVAVIAHASLVSAQPAKPAPTPIPWPSDAPPSPPPTPAPADGSGSAVSPPPPAPAPVVPPAPVAPPSEEAIAQAREFYEAGIIAYKSTKYTIAIAAFSSALALVPGRASVKFALGQAERFQYFVDSDGNRAKHALVLLRAYVDAGDLEKREEAVQYIAELTPVVARWDADQAARNAPPPPPPKPKTELMVSSRTPNARAQIDHGALTAVPVLVEIAPGKHAVHFEAEGFLPYDTDGIAVDGRLIPVEAQLREKPAVLQISAPGGATISIDGKTVGNAPLSPVSLPAGAHFVAVTERGHAPYARDITVARGETVSLHADLPRTGQRRASYLLAAGALVLVAGGAIETGFALSARSDANDLSAQRATRNLDDDELAQQNQRVDDYHSDSTASYFLYGGAAALLATSAWLYFTDQPRVEARSAPSTILTPAPTGGAGGGMTLTLTRRF